MIALLCHGGVGGKDQNRSHSLAAITLPDGFTCDPTKNSITQISKTAYTFTVPVDGGRKEMFEWHMNPKVLRAMLKGGEGNQTQPLAVFKDAINIAT